MHISRVQIENFRNFHRLDVAVNAHAVIVGENKIGKSNLVYALRLVLDPSLPESARQLKEEDFWDGLPRPLTRNDAITISLDFADFEDHDTAQALEMTLGFSASEADRLVRSRSAPVPSSETGMTGDPGVTVEARTRRSAKTFANFDDAKRE
jgi:predicted ATP-dependent endonuclease of OLD family